MGTQLVVGSEIWPSITARVKNAIRVRAAIAYFGEAGHRLLPLRRGDQLVVNLSMAAVKAGVTNPFSLEKLIRQGVLVYSRSTLHAKVVVADRTAIVGSANASARSSDVLDEAVMVSDAPATVRAAIAFIDKQCLEPVRPEYLKLCKKAYRPPRMAGQARASRTPSEPKLWIVLVREWDGVPDEEQAKNAAGEERAAKMLRDTRSSVLDAFYWSHKPTMAGRLRPGHWIVKASVGSGGRIRVLAPQQFLWLHSYARGEGKRRYVFHCEALRRGEETTWAAFRRALPVDLRGRYQKPTTHAITSAAEADAVLSLWTLGGKFRRAVH